MHTIQGAPNWLKNFFINLTMPLGNNLHNILDVIHISRGAHTKQASFFFSLANIAKKVLKSIGFL